MAKIKSNADALADRLTTPVPRVPPIPPEDFLSTGCTQLNLAFTGHPDRGVPKGTFLYLVGDSGSMKTWLAFTLFAEASRNKQFAKHRFVYDAPENGALMEVPHFFGPDAAKRIVPPRGTKAAPVFSETVQQLYYNIDDALDKGPCIYVCDSMDGLNADEDDAKFDAEKKAFEAGDEVKGSYGMAKAKANSKNINRVVQRLRKTGSVLVVISQTRDKIGGMIPGQKTRSGGRALKFYAHLEAWTSVRAPLTRSHMGKVREYGSTIAIDVQKNRVCGWEGKLEVPFIKGFGIDDVGGMVRFLIDEGYWDVTGKRPVGGDVSSLTVTAPEFDFSGKPEALVQQIQVQDDEAELRSLAAGVWRAIVDGVAPKRKPKYGG